jgi:DinB family protein
MRRSKYGYLLLALLVTTGLAGTITSTSISNKERKYAATLMKDTKSDLMKAVKGLSESQLNFKSAPDRWSVKECVFHIATAEKNLWKLVEYSLKQPANPEKRAEIKLSDDALVSLIENRNYKLKSSETLELKNASWKNVDEALDDFNMSRAEHIKYIKSTTEDLRNHVVDMKIGTFDCYQLCLMIGSYSNRHIKQLNEVKANSNFPAQ